VCVWGDVCKKELRVTSKATDSRLKSSSLEPNRKEPGSPQKFLGRRLMVEIPPASQEGQIWAGRGCQFCSSKRTKERRD
jgi:hypothetical protein